jgi:hypothetical protein
MGVVGPFSCRVRLVVPTDEEGGEPPPLQRSGIERLLGVRSRVALRRGSPRTRLERRIGFAHHGRTVYARDSRPRVLASPALGG